MVSGIIGGLQADQAAANAPQPKPQGVLTRASVDASGLAVLRAARADQANKAKPMIALSNNNNNANFGEEGRVALTLRGNLVVSQYILGNDLLGVSPNSADPIQNTMPLSNWPTYVEREYEWPGDGLKGERVKVQCSYKVEGETNIEIVEAKHYVYVIAEICTGDAEFENRYMADASGQVWRSEQWAGQNDVPIFVEIVEPLD